MKPTRPCECSDPGCPVHAKKSACANLASERLYRIDMEDRTGTHFCHECAADAMESGLFTDWLNRNRVPFHG